jgi:hypothetical protein
MKTYHCPKCKDTRFEEILVYAAVSQRVSIDDYNKAVYDDKEVEVLEGTVDRIQCYNCGKVMGDVKDLEDLVPYLNSIGAYEGEDD